MDPPNFQNHPFFNPNSEVDFYDSLGFKEILRDDVMIMVCKHDLEYCNACFCDHRACNNITRSESGKKEVKKIKKKLKKNGCAYSECDKEEGKLLYCTACMLVAYCSKECQVSHWKEHKITCKSLKSYPAGTILEYLEKRIGTGIHLKVLRSSNNGSPYLLKDLGTGKTIKVRADCVSPSIAFYDKDGNVHHPPERNEQIRFSVLQPSEMQGFREPGTQSDFVQCQYFCYGIGLYSRDNILSERSKDGKTHVGSYYRILNVMKNDTILEMTFQCNDRSELKDYVYTIQHCPPIFENFAPYEVDAKVINDVKVFRRYLSAIDHVELKIDSYIKDWESVTNNDAII